MYELSIIIPHFNSPDYLMLLLDSIGEHDSVQTIVVDDKSNRELDKLQSVRESYAERCTFLDNTTDRKGAGICRNIGLDQAAGKWLLFADADDLFVNDWYSTVSAFFDSEGDVVYFPPTSIKGGKMGTRHLKYKEMVESYLDSKPDSELKLRVQFVTPWSKMIRRQLVSDSNIRFGETLYANDVLFATKAGVEAKSIQASPHTIYCVRESEGTLTKNKKFDALYIRQQVFCQTYQYLKKSLPKSEFKKTYVNYVPMATVVKVIRNQYRPSEILRLLKLYRENKVPVITADGITLDKIKRKLKR